MLGIIIFSKTSETIILIFRSSLFYNYFLVFSFSKTQASDVINTFINIAKLSLFNKEFPIFINIELKREGLPGGKKNLEGDK